MSDVLELSAAAYHEPKDIGEVRELIRLYASELSESAAKLQVLLSATKKSRHLDEADAYSDLLAEALQVSTDITGLLELDDVLHEFQNDK